MEKEQGFSLKFMLVGVFIVILLVVGGIIVFSNQDQSANTQNNTGQLQPGDTSLGNNNLNNSQVNIGNGNYRDTVCNFSFNYPSNWKKSSSNLPLPQKPLSQIIFDEPASGNNNVKNSIFSYVCYDSSKYSFDQFVEGDDLSQKKESVSIGKNNWTRIGTFMSTVTNGKLIILQMFFTKYDMSPQNQYEDAFLNIAKSFQ
ncbi:MAG: hypothetical protein Q8P29_04060 [Candidatus Levybacteria bacterium]|nr:hypothetical protein [Candidatus Levybacteria bacterium]